MKKGTRRGTNGTGNYTSCSKNDTRISLHLSFSVRRFDHLDAIKWELKAILRRQYRNILAASWGRYDQSLRILNE